LAPPKLAPRLRSLPPILYMTEPHPMTGYSKAPRGLSVQLRVVRVFTNTTTSPSPWSRQRSSRYTIRAGRNFARSPVSRGRRLYLCLSRSLRHRRLVAPIDLAHRHRAPPRDSPESLQGCLRSFPRYYPRPAPPSLGLHRYEPVCSQDLSREGQVGPYPTRNFATLGSRLSCRHEDWTISSSRGWDVRRMASEDSLAHARK
jgi:hypothetical protein